jgi:membrane dipeptidase
MEYSKRPVIFSHSNPRALCNHERNIGDDQIKACAATGGIIGVVGVNLFLGTQDVRAETMADHVEYLLDIAGPRHVGIGLDYSFPVSAAGTQARVKANPQFWPPKSGYGDVKIEYLPPTHLLELTEVLLSRGHSDEVVRGVLGGNFLRLASEIWRNER